MKSILRYWHILIDFLILNSITTQLYNHNDSLVIFKIIREWESYIDKRTVIGQVDRQYFGVVDLEIKNVKNSARHKREWRLLVFSTTLD